MDTIVNHSNNDQVPFWFPPNLCIFILLVLLPYIIAAVHIPKLKGFLKDLKPSVAAAEAPLPKNE